jgi:hypothetical protein
MLAARLNLLYHAACIVAGASGSIKSPMDLIEIMSPWCGVFE